MKFLLLLLTLLAPSFARAENIPTIPNPGPCETYEEGCERGGEDWEEPTRPGSPDNPDDPDYGGI